MLVGAVVSVARGVFVAVPGAPVLVGALVAVLTGWVAVAGGLVAVGTPAVAVGRGLLSLLEPQAASRIARTATVSSRIRTVRPPCAVHSGQGRDETNPARRAPGERRRGDPAVAIASRTRSPQE